MDEKCVCHINGYRLKDTEARQKATAAGQMANAALEKSTNAEKQIAEAVTTANRAKTTADGANVTAKAAFTTAKLAETNARAAVDTAAAALPRKGGIMLGDVNMNGNNINGATQIIGKRLGGNVLDLEFRTATEPPAMYRAEVLKDYMRLSMFPWKVGTGYDYATPANVIIRGVATPVNSNDAASKAYVDAVAGSGAGSGAGSIQTGTDPTVYGLPVLYLTGDTTPIAASKDNKVTLNYVYGELSGTCTLKGQGATSYKTAQALIQAGKAGKFNYTIKFDTAFEAKAGWGEHEKYCLKANFIDPTHSRNVGSCTLWGKSVKARSTVPAELADLPNGGAIDGFPVVVMLNGEFHGLYTFNIPKDGWMFGLVEDTTKTQAIVGADDHTSATQFKEASLTGYEVEFVSDEDNAAWVETSLTRMISAVMNSDGSDLDTTVAEYLDWDSCIDHYIHTVVDKGTDCVDKNFLLVTFDGVKWYMSVYDRDSIHCLNWDGSGTTRPVSNVTFAECAATSRVYELIYRFKTDALKARYKELRGDILSESRIMQVYENFAWAIPSPLMLEDVKLYPTIPGSGVNTIDQIGRAVRQRLEVCDAWVDALPAQEEPPADSAEGYTNLVPTSTDTDGSIYNGTGYKNNARLSSSGGVSSSVQSGSVVTGFMPWQSKGVIRIKGATYPQSDSEHYYVNFYDSSKTFIYGTDDDSAHGGSGAYAFINVTVDDTSGITTIEFGGAEPGTSIGDAAISGAYFRLNAYGKGADLIVTVNQEIT